MGNAPVPKDSVKNAVSAGENSVDLSVESGPEALIKLCERF